jgi:hypothetical protein
MSTIQAGDGAEVARSIHYLEGILDGPMIWSGSIESNIMLAAAKNTVIFRIATDDMTVILVHVIREHLGPVAKV